MKKLLSTLLAAVCAFSLLSGCGSGPASPGASSGEVIASTPVETSAPQADPDMFTERDRKTDYDSSRAITVTLNGTSASASSDSVKISGSTVQLTEEATYVISGSLSDGMIVVSAGDTAKLQLVLCGASITSQTSAALYIAEADKVFVTLAEGTENTLANGGSFVPIDDSNIDAALFSRQDLTLNGSGSLTVISPAGHGIVGKDDLVITGGTYVIRSASHGLDANDSVRITAADLTVDAGKDAIHCENTEDTSGGFVYLSGGSLKAEAEGDGISAGAYLQIEGGELDLLVGGGSKNGTREHSDQFGGFGGGHGGMPGRPGASSSQSSGTDGDSTSMKGLKAAGDLLITGGTVRINSADDSIHSDASVIINGGTFTLASGDDAIHAEDTLTVTAGQIRISESYEGLEALHIKVSGGDISLTADDDGLNAAGGMDQSGTTGGRDGMFGGRPGGPGGMSAGSGSIVISGGTLYITASGDGIDANGTLEITGGHTVVTGPTRGDTATLDYDRSATISGGTFIGTGASGMAQTFSDSAQGVFAVSVGTQSAGTKIVLQDRDGNTVIEHTPELDFAVVILSSPDIRKGETYTVTVGAQSGTFEAS